MSGIRLEAGKRYETRDGRKVHILKTDVKVSGGSLPCIGILTYGEGTESALNWSITGKHCTGSISNIDIVREWSQYGEDFMQVQVCMTKNYKRADGTHVRILCVDANGTYPVVAIDDCGFISKHRLTGMNSDTDCYNLVEVSPYADFKINDPVMVTMNNLGVWNKRYFAGVDLSTGRARAFKDGATSWSSEIKASIPWVFCRKPTKEELEES